MQKRLTAILGMALPLLLGAHHALAEPPEVGSVVHAGTMGIFCHADVAEEMYKGATKASEVKPRMDAQMFDETCAITVLPVDAAISEVKKVGTVLLDLSSQQGSDDVYSLKISLSDMTVWVLWAETTPPSI